MVFFHRSKIWNQEVRAIVNASSQSSILDICMAQTNSLIPDFRYVLEKFGVAGTAEWGESGGAERRARTGYRIRLWFARLQLEWRGA